MDKYKHIYHGKYKPGDLVNIVKSPDQNTVFMSAIIGKVGLIINHLKEEDGVYSSHHMYNVLVDGRLLHLHALDLSMLSKVERSEEET